MGIYEFNTIEKNFDELVKEVNSMKEVTLKKYKTLEDSTNMKKIQQFISLHLDGVKLQVATGSGWYDKYTYIRVDLNSTTQKLLKEKPTLMMGLNFKNDYSFIEIRIDADSIDETKKKFAEFIDSLYELDVPAHNQNIEIQKSNAATKTKLFDLIKQIGISSSYYDFKTSRSSSRSEIGYHFPHEISKQIPLSYQANKLDELKKSKISSFNDLYSREVSKVVNERLKKEKEEKEKKENKILALLLSKYDLDLECEWSDLMESILNKNKYLQLGDALYRNRCDWSDGCWQAKNGLGRFNCESELDHNIYDEISAFIEDWDGDGRVFRDCTYNYDYLFSIVEDADLMKDYELVREKTDKY